MQKIIEIINSERTPKTWSERTRYDNQNVLIRKTMHILNSGNDLKNLLRDLLIYDSKKKLNLFKRTREKRTLKKLIPIINKRIKQKNKHHFERICFLKVSKKNIDKIAKTSKKIFIWKFIKDTLQTFYTRVSQPWFWGTLRRYF